MKKKVYLALGSNIGNREEMLQRAIDELHGPAITITRLSSVYETKPMDVTDQPMFLNMVVEAETSLFPMMLLKRVQDVEKGLGRKKLIDKGPRSIDIDILLFGRAIIDSPQLQVPHPRMTERRFVLEPLNEIAPDLRHPRTRRTIRDLLGATLSQGVARTDLRLKIPAVN